MNRREFCKGVAAAIPLAGVIGMVSLEKRAELLGDGSPAWELPEHDDNSSDPRLNMRMPFGLPRRFAETSRENLACVARLAPWPNMGR